MRSGRRRLIDSIFDAPRWIPSPKTPMKLWKKLTPWLVAAFCLYFVIAFIFEGEPTPGYALREFGRVLVPLDGRIKPLDPVARTSLLSLCGKQSHRLHHGNALLAIERVADLVSVQ